MSIESGGSFEYTPETETPAEITPDHNPEAVSTPAGQAATQGYEPTSPEVPTGAEGALGVVDTPKNEQPENTAGPLDRQHNPGNLPEGKFSVERTGDRSPETEQSPAGRAAMQGYEPTGPEPPSSDAGQHGGMDAKSAALPASDAASLETQENPAYRPVTNLAGERLDTPRFEREPIPAATQGYDINPSDPATGDWVDRGVVDVPVAALPNPEGVNSPADFNHHISWDDAQNATRQLPEIQRQAAEGKTGDDFWAADQAAGLDYAHGQQRIYDLYYGSGPVHLNKDGDRYDIVSGRHRIYAAKALGLESIPAKVTERIPPSGGAA